MKLSRILLTGALSVSMLAMGAVGSFASPVGNEVDKSDYVGEGSAVINKSVKKAAQGVTQETKEFYFTFTPYADFVGNKAEEGDIPTQKVTVNSNETSNTATVNLSSFESKERGTYVYTVAETALTVENGYGWTSDSKTYILTVVVQADTTVNYTIADGDTKEKIDSSDNGAGKFTFENVFTKRAGSDTDPDPDDPDTPPTGTDIDDDGTPDSFVVTKAYGNSLYNKDGESFEFTINFTADENGVNGTNTTFEGVVVDTESGEPDATVGDNNDGKISVANGNKVNLKAGQSLVFNNIPAGTTASVVETANSNYTTTYTTVSNGKNGDNTEVVLGENANSVTVTNNANDVDITGLVMNNAPYVALIALALAMAAAYIMIRRRRAGEME